MAVHRVTSVGHQAGKGEWKYWYHSLVSVVFLRVLLFSVLGSSQSVTNLATSRLKNSPARQLSRSARKRRVVVPQSRLPYQNSQIALTRSASVPFDSWPTHWFSFFIEGSNCENWDVVLLRRRRLVVFLLSLTRLMGSRFARVTIPYAFFRQPVQNLGAYIVLSGIRIYLQFYLLTDTCQDSKVSGLFKIYFSRIHVAEIFAQYGRSNSPWS